MALETLRICQELQIEDCNLTQLDRGLYKKIVIAACHKKNEPVGNHVQGKCILLVGETPAIHLDQPIHAIKGLC